MLWISHQNINIVVMPYNLDYDGTRLQYDYDVSNGTATSTGTTSRLTASNLQMYT